MRIPDLLLYTVCYIVRSREPRDGDYLGTGFFIGVPRMDGQPTSHLYLVTAKHLLPRRRDDPRKVDGPVYIRLMNLERTAVVTEEIAGEWILGRDPDEDNQLDSDVAIIPYDGIPIASIGVKTFMSAGTRSDWQIGVGDHLTVIGLYTPRPGKSRLLPIVRTGSIAAMPEEALVDRRTAQLYHAYLAELRSFGGLSGSPVWVDLGPDRHVDGQVAKAGRHYLLGLIRSHWYYVGDDTTPPTERDAAEDLRRREVHMGITAVTPVAEIRRLLLSPDDLKRRLRAEKEGSVRADTTATPTPEMNPGELATAERARQDGHWYRAVESALDAADLRDYNEDDIYDPNG